VPLNCSAIDFHLSELLRRIVQVDLEMPTKRSLAPETPSPRSKRVRKSLNYTEHSDSETLVNGAAETSVSVEIETKVTISKVTPRKRKLPKKPVAATPETATEQPAPKKTKPKSKKSDEEPEMLATRTIAPKILVGAHVSAAGGAHNAAKNCHRIGGNAFALFLKSQRKWAFEPLSAENEQLFKQECDKHEYCANGDDGVKPIVPHGSYLVNLAHTDKERGKQAYATFIDDLSRCRKMGIKLYNFHPGAAVGEGTRGDALKQLASQLNKAHKDEESGEVITLLETMAAVGGNTIGCKFEELAEVIGMVEDKSRVGVCLDTCHVYAAGYDLRTPEAYNATLDNFEKSIGLKYLRAFHVNDSKAPLKSGRDLHANIGAGCLGLRAFHNLVNDERMWGIPFILETPIDKKDSNGKTIEDHSVWAKEIKLLESLVGMDVESEEFKTLEVDLSKEGKDERDRIAEQVKKSEEKASKKKKPKVEEPNLTDIRALFNSNAK
jgi:AP endonuclease-1